MDLQNDLMETLPQAGAPQVVWKSAIPNYDNCVMRSPLFAGDT